MVGSDAAHSEAGRAHGDEKARVGSGITLLSTDESEPPASISAALEALQSELEAERRGAEEARQALVQSAQFGQLLLTRNEDLQRQLQELQSKQQKTPERPDANSEDRELGEALSQLQAKNRRLDEECHRLEGEVENLRVQLESGGAGEARSSRRKFSQDESDEESAGKHLRDQQLKRTLQLLEDQRLVAQQAEEHAAALDERNRVLEESTRDLREQCSHLEAECLRLTAEGEKWRRAAREKEEECAELREQVNTSPEGEEALQNEASTTQPAATSTWRQQSSQKGSKSFHGDAEIDNRSPTSNKADALDPVKAADSKDSQAAEAEQLKAHAALSQAVEELQTQLQEMEGRLRASVIEVHDLRRQKAEFESRSKKLASARDELQHRLLQETGRSEVLTEQVEQLSALLQERRRQQSVSLFAESPEEPPVEVARATPPVGESALAPELLSAASKGGPGEDAPPDVGSTSVSSEPPPTERRRQTAVLSLEGFLNGDEVPEENFGGSASSASSPPDSPRAESVPPGSRGQQLWRTVQDFVVQDRPEGGRAELLDIFGLQTCPLCGAANQGHLGEGEEPLGDLSQFLSAESSTPKWSLGNLLQRGSVLGSRGDSAHQQEQPAAEVQRPLSSAWGALLKGLQAGGQGSSEALSPRDDPSHGVAY